MAIRRFSGSSLTTGSKSSKLWDQETTLGTFESIATATVDASGAATITFSNIPQNYTHLQIRATPRASTAPNGYAVPTIKFNSDAGANYENHYLMGDGVSATAGAAANMNIGLVAGSASTSVFGTFILDVLDYANTSKYKTVRNLTGFDNNGVGGTTLQKGGVQLHSLLWLSTSAITQIDIADADAAGWSLYSFFALYGIRGA